MIKLDFKEPTGVKFVEPSMLTAKLNPADVESSYLEMFGEAKNYVYGSLRLNQSLSNQVYKISDKAWAELISAKMVDENDDPTLELNKEELKYILTGENNLVTITEAASVETNWEKFKQAISDFSQKEGIKIDDLYNEDAILQKLIITKEIEGKSYSALNIVELDFKWGFFVVRSGIKYNSDGIMVVMEKPSLAKKRIGEFLEAFDLESEINLADKMSLLVAQDFELSDKLTSKVSVRELLDIMKYAGMQIDFEKDKGTEGKVTKVVGINEDDSNKICDTLNSFKIPFKSLARMSYLKKSFKQDNLSFMDILKMLSQYVYNTNLNVNGRLLGVVADALLSKDYDQAVIKTEIDAGSVN